jgi:hypothetical protein
MARVTAVFARVAKAAARFTPKKASQVWPVGGGAVVVTQRPGKAARITPVGSGKAPKAPGR